jgi:hypothetical protein
MPTYNAVECAMPDEESSMFRYRLALFNQLKKTLNTDRQARYAVNLLRDGKWSEYNKFIEGR